MPQHEPKQQKGKLWYIISYKYVSDSSTAPPHSSSSSSSELACRRLLLLLWLLQWLGVGGGGGGFEKEGDGGLDDALQRARGLGWDWGNDT